MQNPGVTIHGVTIKKDDIVKIKFRKLEDVLQDKRQQSRINDIMCFYGIDDHMTTFLQGCGHFKVNEICGLNSYLRLSNDGSISRRKSNSSVNENALEEIAIHDYNTDTFWHLNEILIESISVENDVADSHFSENHQLSILLIDSTLYLNGQPITQADSKIFQMFEKVMADAAINSILNAADIKTSDDDDSY